MIMGGSYEKMNCLILNTILIITIFAVYDIICMFSGYKIVNLVAVIIGFLSFQKIIKPYYC
jgi:hypothetical protein